MDPATTVRAVWDRFEAREWDAAATLMHPDVVVTWPQTQERFEGRDAFIAMNRNYPEGWRLHVERVWNAGPHRAVALVRVPFDGSTEWATSFVELKDGLVWHVLETWAAAGPAPAWREKWRAPWVEP